MLGCPSIGLPTGKIIERPSKCQLDHQFLDLYSKLMIVWLRMMHMWLFQKLDIHLQHLRAYTMAQLTAMIDLLERFAALEPAVRRPPRRADHQEREDREEEREEERPEVPYVSVTELRNEDSQKLAKVIRELRIQAEDMAGVTDRVINCFKRIIVRQICSIL